MDKKVVLAVAGAGKTYYICESIDPEKKNLILAYTHSNVNNIVRELYKKYGEVPERTSVMTFDAFVYRLIIRPYEPSILEFFKANTFRSNGISFQEPPIKGQKVNNHFIKNPNYFNQDDFRHYLSKNNRYYCKELTRLVLRTGKKDKMLVKRVGENLNKFFDFVAIDEFQDYRNCDYELMMQLSKYVQNMLLVGDYYQHSVSGQNNSGKPFKIRDRYIDYNEFRKNLEKEGFEVDDCILKKSRRCGKEVCEFISDKLGISIESHDNHESNVIVADKELASNLLSNNSIVKLINKESYKQSYKALNWSYSKGDTMDSVCIILTGATSGICNDSFDHNKLSPITKNELYVALTRSKGDIYLITQELYKKCNNS